MDFISLYNIEFRPIYVSFNITILEKKSSNILSNTDVKTYRYLQRLIILHFNKVELNDYYFMLANKRVQVNKRG